MKIDKLEVSVDESQMMSAYHKITADVPWFPLNQIGLNCRVGSSDIWKDACGSLFNRETGERKAYETDFSTWNLPENNYIRQQIEQLAEFEHAKLGRARIMRLLPKTGLSVHRDFEIRYHYVLTTNNKSFFCYNQSITTDYSALPTAAVCYHIPKDNCWYRVDTRSVHWVYNGGDTDRVHLVICGT